MPFFIGKYSLFNNTVVEYLSFSDLQVTSFWKNILPCIAHVFRFTARKQWTIIELSSTESRHLEIKCQRIPLTFSLFLYANNGYWQTSWSKILKQSMRIRLPPARNTKSIIQFNIERDKWISVVTYSQMLTFL